MQRVASAHVTTAGTEVARIGLGLLVLVGLADGDGDPEIAWMAQKVAGLRVFSDLEGQMNLTLAEVGGSILAVSQFTLLGDCRKGRRPSFAHALAPDAAAPLFADFVARLAVATGPVATGRFGQVMQVHLVNDGPVTLVIDRTRHERT